MYPAPPWTSHNLNQVRGLQLSCNRIFFIRKGRHWKIEEKEALTSMVRLPAGNRAGVVYTETEDRFQQIWSQIMSKKTEGKEIQNQYG